MCQPTIQDGSWTKITVKDLTDQHIITLLGRELNVVYLHPSERGGDFFVLEAHGTHLEDIVSFTIDKNQKIWARLN